MPDAAQIDADDFARVDMRVGRILEATPSRATRPSYRLVIDLGSALGQRTSSAAIRDWYRPDELVGRLVICVCNLPPRQVANVMSEVLCLGSIGPDGRVFLLAPDSVAQPGERIA